MIDRHSVVDFQFCTSSCAFDHVCGCPTWAVVLTAMSVMARFLYTLERMSALWPGSAAAVKSQLLSAAYDAARAGGDPLVLALDALRRAAASGQLPDGGLLEDLRPLLKGDALVKALHPAVQLSALALLRELLPELLEDRAGDFKLPAPALRCNCMLQCPWSAAPLRKATIPNNRAVSRGYVTRSCVSTGMTGPVWDKILDKALVDSRSTLVREALFELLSDAWLRKPALQVPNTSVQCVTMLFQGVAMTASIGI